MSGERMLPAGVLTLLNGTRSLSKQMKRQQDMARKYGGNLKQRQREEVLRALREIQARAADMIGVLSIPGEGGDQL